MGDTQCFLLFLEIYCLFVIFSSSGLVFPEFLFDFVLFVDISGEGLFGNVCGF